jgi:hypothetical protein
MNKWIYAITLPIIAATSIATVKNNPNEMRDAFTAVIPLPMDSDTTLSGESDDEIVKAVVSLDDKSMLAAIKVEQDGELMRLPKSSYAGLSGAKRAWLEERGALTTLVIEGLKDGKEWRLALLFHPEQLWRRRLSIEGQRKDQMIFYDRDEDNMEPTEMETRKAHSRGFYNNYPS